MEPSLPIFLSFGLEKDGPRRRLHFFLFLISFFVCLFFVCLFVCFFFVLFRFAVGFRRDSSVTDFHWRVTGFFFCFYRVIMIIMIILSGGWVWIEIERRQHEKKCAHKRNPVKKPSKTGLQASEIQENPVKPGKTR